jgi:hypothetical protein
LLETQQANIMVAFETDELPVVTTGQLLDKKLLAREPLVPVVAPGAQAAN